MAAAMRQRVEPRRAGACAGGVGGRLQGAGRPGRPVPRDLPDPPRPTISTPRIWWSSRSSRPAGRRTCAACSTSGAGRATLIILPKWITMPDPARRGWVRAIAPGAGQMAARRSIGNVDVAVADGDARRPDLGRGRGHPGPASRMPVPGRRRRRSAARRDAADRPSRRRRGKDGGAPSSPSSATSRITSSPTPTCSTITASPMPTAAAAALALIDAAQRDRRRAASISTSPSTASAAAARRACCALAFEPPFLAMTLALVVAALLAGLHGAFRFGPAAARGAGDRLRQGGPGREQRRPDPPGASARRALGGAYADVDPPGGGARRRRAGLAAGRGARRLSRPAVAQRPARAFSELAAAACATARDRARAGRRRAGSVSWKKDIIR